MFSSSVAFVCVETHVRNAPAFSWFVLAAVESALMAALVCAPARSCSFGARKMSHAPATITAASAHADNTTAVRPVRFSVFFFRRPGTDVILASQHAAFNLHFAVEALALRVHGLAARGHPPGFFRQGPPKNPSANDRADRDRRAEIPFPPGPKVRSRKDRDRPAENSENC